MRQGGDRFGGRFSAGRRDSHGGRLRARRRNAADQDRHNGRETCQKRCSPPERQASPQAAARALAGFPAELRADGCPNAARRLDRLDVQEPGCKTALQPSTRCANAGSVSQRRCASARGPASRTPSASSAASSSSSGGSPPPQCSSPEGGVLMPRGTRAVAEVPAESSS